MVQDDRIMTRHPQGKKGVHILRRRYDIIRNYILDILNKEDEITYEELNDRAVDDLSDSFDGKVPWYVVSVKLDLEARGTIERIPRTSPHRIRLVNSD